MEGSNAVTLGIIFMAGALIFLIGTALRGGIRMPEFRMPQLRFPKIRIPKPKMPKLGFRRKAAAPAEEVTFEAVPVTWTNVFGEDGAAYDVRTRLDMIDRLSLIDATWSRDALREATSDPNEVVAEAARASLR